MKKVLIIPFLNMQTGHHQVADTLIDWLKILNPLIKADKVDILEYAYGNVELLVSHFYIKSIGTIPSVYSWLYKKNAVNNGNKERFLIYDLLFQRAMLKLIKEKQPDIIICTHCLPSYILSQLKLTNAISIPIVNVYT
ncbi:MGDG synthase family glycosyltransferase, partial [Piscibacillus halophilus]